MIKKAMILAATLGLLAPAAAYAQQNMALVGQGAQVYSANCGRCHNARSSTERTDAEWVPIVMHMRARANLTKAQAEAVLAYLQATNMPEGSMSMGAGAGQAGAGSAATGTPRVVTPRHPPASPARRRDPGGN